MTYTSLTHQVQRELVVQDIFILAQMSIELSSLPFSATNAFSPLLNVATLWQKLIPLWYQLMLPFQEYPANQYSAREQSLVQALQPVFQAYNNWSASGPSANNESIASVVSFWSVFYNDTQSVSSARALFDASNHVPLALQQAVYWATVKYGSESDYNAVLQLFNSTSSMSSAKQQQHLLLALAGAPTHALCKQTLMLYSQQGTNSAVLSLVRNMIQYNPVCRMLAFDFVVDWLAKRSWQASGSAATASIINSFDGLLSNRAYYERVSALLDSHKQYVTEQQRHSTLAKIRINIDIVKRNQSF
jgi:hypothetical protein